MCLNKNILFLTLGVPDSKEASLKRENFFLISLENLVVLCLHVYQYVDLPQGQTVILMLNSPQYIFSPLKNMIRVLIQI